LLLFFAGFIQDFLVTKYTQCIFRDRAGAGANLGTFVSALGVYVLNKIEVGNLIIPSIFYFAGLWFGTYVGIKLKSY